LESRSWCGTCTRTVRCRWRAILAHRIGARVQCQAPSAADPSVLCHNMNETGGLIAQVRRPLGVVGGNTVDIETASTCLESRRSRMACQRLATIQRDHPEGRPNSHRRSALGGASHPRTWQRLLSLPVYGGTSEQASANKMQGQAFAVLPPDLPAHTPLRVQIWLTADETFELDAWLESGVN